MALPTKEFLSESDNGRGILIEDNNSPGTQLHTADTDLKDEVFLFAVNTHTEALEITVEWGGTDDPGDTIPVTVPARAGLMLDIPGLVLSAGYDVRAFCATVDKVAIFGYVNRIR